MTFRWAMKKAVNSNKINWKKLSYMEQVKSVRLIESESIKNEI